MSAMQTQTAGTTKFLPLAVAALVLAGCGAVVAQDAPEARFAADAQPPAVTVTQELLNSIHVPPRLIHDPFPAYAEKDLPFADRYHELDAVRGANVFVSDDEGASWRFRGGIIFKDSCFNEHSVVELDDGRLWMLSRGMREAFQSFSTDGGKTWQPQSTFFPHVNSKAVFRRLASGEILLVKHGQDMVTAPEWKGPGDWGARKELTAFLSADEGRTWSPGLLLDERANVSYPDIAQAPNGDIYVHYDRERTGAAEILFARFRAEDVKAGRLVSDGAALKNVVKSRQHGMHGAGKEGAAAASATTPK